MSSLLQKSRVLNEDLSQVTNQEGIAQLMQSWKSLEQNIDTHLEKVRVLVDVVKVFKATGVIVDVCPVEGIKMNQLHRDLAKLKAKFQEDQQHVMHGDLWSRTSERLLAAKNKLESELRGIWKTYVLSMSSSIEGVDEFLELANVAPSFNIPEIVRVNESLASLQQRSRALPYENPAGAISTVKAYCNSISKAINDFETAYRQRGEMLLQSIVGLRDQLILEDESIKRRIDNIERDTKVKLERPEGEVSSYGRFIKDVCELEDTIRELWSECVQSLIVGIQYVEPFLESEDESRLMDQIVADQNRLRAFATDSCSSDAILQVNRSSDSIKDQIKTLFAKADLSGMPENVSVFMKKLQREGATLEDLQDGVFEWLQSEGKLKHFKLK